MKLPIDSARALLQSKLTLAIDEELELNRQLLNSAVEAQRRLVDKDCELHTRGSGASESEVESIDGQIDTVRHQINEEEIRLIAAEQHYSKILSERKGLGQLMVGLSEDELADLEKLSHSYQAFEPHLVVGLDASAVGSEAKGCLTCSAICGGCTGCGQACSQLNACIARPAS